MNILSHKTKFSSLSLSPSFLRSLVANFFLCLFVWQQSIRHLECERESYTFGEYKKLAESNFFPFIWSHPSSVSISSTFLSHFFFLFFLYLHQHFTPHISPSRMKWHFLSKSPFERFKSSHLYIVSYKYIILNQRKFISVFRINQLCVYRLLATPWSPQSIRNDPRKSPGKKFFKSNLIWPHFHY